MTRWRLRDRAGTNEIGAAPIAVSSARKSDVRDRSVRQRARSDRRGSAGRRARRLRRRHHGPPPVLLPRHSRRRHRLRRHPSSLARPRQPPRGSTAGRAAVPCDPGDGERTARARPRLRHLAEPEPRRWPTAIWGWPRSRASSSAARRSTSSSARSPPRTARTPSASSCPAPAPTARPASRHIKAHGGLSIAQDPAEAEYTDMPGNAIATGCVDLVLRVEDIPARIVAYRDHLKQVARLSPRRCWRTTRRRCAKSSTCSRARTGNDFSSYKPATILRRIHRRMTVANVPTLVRYAGWLREHPDEAAALMKELLISVTHFFRDPEAFAVLQQRVVPRLFDGKGPNDQVRVWVPACATGEEAYSIAMLLVEHLDSVDRAAARADLCHRPRRGRDRTARDGLLQQRRHRRHPAGAARSILPSRGRRAIAFAASCARWSCSRTTTWSGIRRSPTSI